MKNIVIWDVETTGLSPKEDFIIQLSCMKVNPETKEILGEKSWYIKPAHKYSIDPRATEVHGLTKEFIEENGKTIKEIADEFLSFIDGCDFMTYNGNNFDIKFLYKDFEMFGYDLKLEDRKFFDAYAMECTYNPRNLGTVYKKYTGNELEGAHDAMNDVRATWEVWKSQMDVYQTSYDDLKNMNENNLLSPDGSIRYSNPLVDDTIVFVMGKYKDTEFMEVMEKDYNYIQWFMNNVASNYTKEVLRKYYKKHKKS